MNPISNAVRMIKMAIPPQILARCFIDNSLRGFLTPSKSVDSQIVDLVIRPTVLMDCNLIGGNEVRIPIGDLPYDTITEPTSPFLGSAVIGIPLERTQGLAIISPSRIEYINNASQYAPGYTSGGFGSAFVNTSSLLQSAQGLLDAAEPIPKTSTARLDLVGPNTIAVSDVSLLTPFAALVAVLANEDNMNNLKPTAYREFGELCTLAVKAYIYNNLIIEIDSGELRLGQQLGTFKNIIESYSDAYQNYQTYFKDVWRKVSFMNDDMRHGKALRRAVPLVR